MTSTAAATPFPKPHRDRGIEGRMATWYAATTSKMLRDFQELAQKVARELPEGGSVLEVAPGPGYFCVELAKLGPYRVTGVDLSPDMVRIARENASRAGVSAEFTQGNASNLPFAADSFDFLVCRAAFKNFARPVQALHEMHRVLKPGGRALIIDLRRNAPVNEVSREVDRMGLSAVNRIMTKLTFRIMLLKSAYSREHFEQMLAHTPFRTRQINEGGIGFEIWLTK
jgi:ubiquinone/menaquinone biosynthesis C-methylase UbiE